MSHVFHSFTHPPWEYDIAYGRVPGSTQNFTIGQRDLQSSSSGSITIWDAAESEGDSGNIVYLTENSNIWVASTSTSDTNVTLVVRGLNEEFVEIQEVVVTNGQTPVQLVNQYCYIQFVVNIGAEVNQGNIYISATAAHTLGVPDDVTKIQSKILPLLGITHNAFLIVPKDKVAVAVAIRGGTDSTTKPSEVTTWIKQPGSVFINTVKYSISPGFSQYLFPQPVASTAFKGITTPSLGEGVILEFKSKAVSNNTNVFFGIDFIISDVRDFNV